MTEPPSSNWERGRARGRRPLFFLLAIVLIILVAGVGLFVWLFNSPGFRVADEIYHAAPDVVTQSHYASVTGSVDTLTIVVARDVTRDEALALQCRTVIPLLVENHLTPRIVILHPDNAFVLDGSACP